MSTFNAVLWRTRMHRRQPIIAPKYYFRYLTATLNTGRSQSTEHSVENPAQRFRPSSTINKTGSRLVNCQPDGKGSNHQSPSGNHQKFFRDTECPWAGVALKGPSREAGQHPPVRPRRAPSCTLASREVACCDPCGDSDIGAFRLPRRIQSPRGTRWCFLEYSTAKPGEKRRLPYRWAGRTARVSIRGLRTASTSWNLAELSLHKGETLSWRQPFGQCRWPWLA
ncbi:hypothetical protein BKA56DRAFT_89665 [Ilyonectria sp. MPI-CAGE-AT-0026]|nr:hypothetical protein BKA56DRAFT_89665 [Ilyonectria sp. MPI-CAGE-AT-0026]